MALVKTPHFKFIDGLLHQLHEPHPNTPEEKPEWVEVEGQDKPKVEPKVQTPAGAKT